jgi:hypothetical protein
MGRSGCGKTQLHNSIYLSQRSRVEPSRTRNVFDAIGEPSRA